MEKFAFFFFQIYIIYQQGLTAQPAKLATKYTYSLLLNILRHESQSRFPCNHMITRGPFLLAQKNALSVWKYSKGYKIQMFNHLLRTREDFLQ